MSKLDTATCPTCGGVGLAIDMRLRAQDIGDSSLAGQQMKVSARELPYLYCPRHPCGYGIWGWIEGKYAVFPRD